ncbi:MerR family transcriptional regulator [Pseudonocardia sulfidoxydans NBRC 16205]|uniref:MerR family transcriptional regulator n=1 Tax=Pseudonocardia sulfidoxydans NBRC 16205 TaxID=1223511 RepID=A0A511DCP7_9PSEU|nr:MerR family transcriptional regulator [Pseudonocardia sulfidoxydans]GEL22327.1 MerR family transcriptional regulator [Pseudonocardia sulfidoxydans NBRC 16205]
MRDHAQLWKVGELADTTGLTVRTLHYWGELGLVVPSSRTTSGHRLYGVADVERVYQVVALRELGLSLDAIGRVLDEGGPGLAGVLEAHVTQVRAQLDALRTLEATLSVLVTRVRRTGSPAPSDLLGLIDEVSKMNEKFNEYFTDEQLATLSRRREQLGEDRIAEAESEWPILIAKVQAEKDAGTDPGEPRVQALAARWMELLAEFDGGDPAIREANGRMLTENQSEVGGGSHIVELIDYINSSNQARQN